MDVLQTHKQVVDDYASYIQSFLNIADPAIRSTVESKLAEGRLWPEPLLQFNPAYESAGSVDTVADQGVLHPAIADILKGYSLYKHQVDAIKLGTGDRDFIVTSGTGSGKSLTYIGTIFHDLLRHPSESGIRAVIVYPMNALINSQFEEFKRYQENYEKATGKTFPISFGQYTGQEKEEVRERMRENPPHVLLTNYMMLELLLSTVTSWTSPRHERSKRVPGRTRGFCAVEMDGLRPSSQAVAMASSLDRADLDKPPKASSWIR
ncbi:MAG: DEAD/DEAH box helicase [Pseudomonadota bacterium]